MFFLILSESSIQIQLAVILIFTFLGFYLRISFDDWIIKIFLSGFVLSIEALNTSIEKICDFINPNFNKKIGLIKDIGAGAVSFAVISSLIILTIIYYPYLSKAKLFELGFIASKSGHSRGSTVDLTLVYLSRECRGKKLDMGGNWDFFGDLSNYGFQDLNKNQIQNRKKLRDVMTTFGFKVSPNIFTPNNLSLIHI